VLVQDILGSKLVGPIKAPSDDPIPVEGEEFTSSGSQSNLLRGGNTSEGDLSKWISWACPYLLHLNGESCTQL